MAHFSLIVQEWEWYLYTGWTTGRCKIFFYTIIAKNKAGKGCSTRRPRLQCYSYDEYQIM